MAYNKCCYYPDETLISDDSLIPCDPTSSSDGACCRPDSVCLSNGLCFQQGALYSNRISRDGCTDSGWGEDCPQYCDTIEDRGMYLTLAQVGSSAGGLYCCGSYDSTSEQCQHANAAKTDPFTIRAGYVLFPNTSTPLDSYSSTNGSAVSLIENGAISEKSKPESDCTTIGAATGVPLGVASVIAVVCVVVLWRLVKKLAKELAAMQRHISQDDGSRGTGYLPLFQGSPVSSPELNSFNCTCKVAPSPERQELDVQR